MKIYILVKKLAFHRVMRNQVQRLLRVWVLRDKRERRSLQQQGRRQNKGRSGYGGRGRRSGRLHSAHEVKSVMNTNDY